MRDNTTAVDTSTPTTTLTGVRRGAFVGYQWLLLAFLLLGGVQIFFAGLGVFNLDGQELGANGETAFGPHRNLGFAMGGLALIILILALIARPGARAIILSAVMFLLAFLAQSLLAGLGEDSPVFGGLHALDGLGILAIAGFLYASSWRR
jgi:carbon starvation protein CstA